MVPVLELAADSNSGSGSGGDGRAAAPGLSLLLVQEPLASTAAARLSPSSVPLQHPTETFPSSMNSSIHQVEGSRKRQRTDCGGTLDHPTGAPEMATAQDEVNAATRDSDYWFEDGNIILLSQGVAFRVYKGLLGEHSAVFGSMFHVGQAPQAVSDQAYGCPVIRLDDAPADLRGLFRLIFPSEQEHKVSPYVQFKAQM